MTSGQNAKPHLVKPDTRLPLFVPLSARSALSCKPREAVGLGRWAELTVKELANRNASRDEPWLAEKRAVKTTAGKALGDKEMQVDGIP